MPKRLFLVIAVLFATLNAHSQAPVMRPIAKDLAIKVFQGAQPTPLFKSFILRGFAPQSAEQNLQYALQRHLQLKLDARALEQNKRLARLLMASSFYTFHKDMGLVAQLTRQWDELLRGVNTAYFGTNIQSHQYAADLRKQLLQTDANLSELLTAMVTLQSQLADSLTPSGQELLQQSNTVATLLVTPSGATSSNPYANALQQLFAHYRPARALQPLSPDPQLYEQLMAFAYGEGKFPFLESTAIRELRLPYMNQSEITMLINKPNTPACQTLKAWGWKEQDIVNLIKRFDKNPFGGFYHPNPTAELRLHYDALSAWKTYWASRIPREQVTLINLSRALRDDAAAPNR